MSRSSPNNNDNNDDNNNNNNIYDDVKTTNLLKRLNSLFNRILNLCIGVWDERLYNLWH